jgi:hypothetical protein
VTAIFRAPMRARDRRDLPAGAGAEHGVEHGVVGIGRADGARVERFGAVPEGSFVWTRLTDGSLRLGRIDGPLHQADAEEAADVGIAHVRAATWLERPFAEDEVPAAVARTFARGGLNFQRTHDAAAEQRTAELWDEG